MNVNDDEFKYSQQLASSLKELDVASAALSAVKVPEIHGTYNSKDPLVRLKTILQDNNMKAHQSMASYAQYRSLSDEEKKRAGRQHANFDNGLIFSDVIAQTKQASEQAMNKIAVEAQKMRPSADQIAITSSLAPRPTPQQGETTNAQAQQVQQPQQAPRPSGVPRPTQSGPTQSGGNQ